MLTIPMNSLLWSGHEARTPMSAIVAQHAVLSERSNHNSLVARVCAGDPTALAELYDQHASALLGFAKRLLGDADAAQDLVHEVFIGAPRSLAGFQGQSSVRTFLTSVAINHARHHVRSASRRRAAGDRMAREPEPEVGTPEQEISRARLASALNSALDTLPIEQRVAFVLCEVEERTSREAAELIGVPEATVRTRLFHGKRKLREELDRRGIR
jgi:RNA polymerase sigma-70 factor (ECF subfamily)